MITINEIFKEFEREFKQESENWKALMGETYDPKKMRTINDFLIYAGKTSFGDVCNKDMAEFLFKNDGQDMLLRKDEPSMIRKEMYGEKSLFCSYYYEDLNDLATGSTRSVDVICSKKEIDSRLKQTLEDLDFFADSVIDFETLEFPHYQNESYYGFSSELVNKLHKDFKKRSKEVSKEFRVQDSRLYRDIEKFHITFAAGTRRTGKSPEFIPVYVGFGTNEPYGLSFDGKLGKARFMKWSFNSDESGFERGVFDESAISSEDFKRRFGAFSTDNIFWGKDYVIRTIEDETSNPEYESIEDVTFDANRFKGFIKIVDNGKEQKGIMLTPRFDFSPVNQKEYFEAVLGKRSLGIPVLRNEKDIFNLIGDNMTAYEEFASVNYYPGYVVNRFGLENVFKAVCNKLSGGDFNYINSANVGSDVYMIGTDSHERLKISSLIIGNYIATGKFNELLNATHEGRTIAPL